MNIGDKVRWTSQAGGSTKTKEGVVHAVVPPHRSARSLLPAVLAKSQKKFDTDYSDRTRYIVAVPRGGKSTIVDYYCPQPGLLKLVDPIQEERDQ